MTEPIAVDVPGKPAFSRTAALPPGVGPLVEALTATSAAPVPMATSAAPTAPAPAPKVEPPKPAAPKVEAPKIEVPKVEAPKVEAPKVEAPKPASAPAPSAPPAAVVAAATVAAAAVGVPPVAAAPAAGAVAKLMQRFTRKQLTVGAAVFSLVAGAGAIRFLAPANSAPPAETAKAESNEKVKVAPAAPTPPAPAQIEPHAPPVTKTPSIEVVPHSGNEIKLPPVPSTTQLAPPVGAKTNEFAPSAPILPPPPAG